MNFKTQYWCSNVHCRDSCTSLTHCHNVYLDMHHTHYIPLSFSVCPSWMMGSRILSCFCPFVPLFTRQSTKPPDCGDRRRVRLLVVVAVWSAFKTVPWLGSVLADVIQVITGAGFPVAEHDTTTSVPVLRWGGVCDFAVFTSDIPSDNIRKNVFKCHPNN